MEFVQAEVLKLDGFNLRNDADLIKPELIAVYLSIYLSLVECC